MPDSEFFDLIVAGGGAAGYFGAISCAESYPEAKILIAEKSPSVLGKVRISGGGRCNVTHACFDPKELVAYYPRGSRQLLGPFHRWGPADTIDWFENHGVPLKTENDNRVFPQSDTSQSIIDALDTATRRSGVVIRTNTEVARVETSDDTKLVITFGDGTQATAGNLLLTTGGTRNPAGVDIAARFGHTAEKAAPSLFTFKIDDTRIEGLQGLSAPDCTVTVPAEFCGGKDLRASGPVLVTHWGLSGPGILRVSAWGARELQEYHYRFDAIVNWCGSLSESQMLETFARLRKESPRKLVINDPQFHIPARLWKRLLQAACDDTGISPSQMEDLRWPHLPRELARHFARQLTACRFRVDGKSMNKEEFVTCGGINLDEVDFRTMRSRKDERLFFAGEVLDIDGITGGFNFQSAWTTGRIAGESIAEAICARL